MKRIGLILSLAAVLGVFGFTGCQKDDVAGTALVTVVMDDSPETLLKNQKTLYVDSGYVNIVAAEIVAKEDGAEYQKTARTRTRVNLSSGAYEYPVELELMKGSYDSTKLALTLDAEDNYPAIIVYGRYYDSNNNEIPFEFVYNDSVTIYTKLDDQLIVDDSLPAFVVYVAPSKWFKDVSDQMISNATLYDGTLLISDTANVDIYNAIIENIGKSAYMQVQNRYRWENMYMDDNHDTNDSNM